MKMTKISSILWSLDKGGLDKGLFGKMIGKLNRYIQPIN